MPLNALTGSRVRERRLALGLRQAEVAKATGISASYLNLIEHNRRRIAGDVLRRLAQALATEVDALEEGAPDDLAEALRAAAQEPGGERAELERLDEYLGRFPRWAGVTAGLRQRIGQLERAVAALNDRIAHDPHLGAALHEVLSAVSSVRSTAGILAETEDIEPEWRSRFHANLYKDSERLARGAEALVTYLEGAEQDATAGTGSPEEELDRWLAARGWHLEGDAAAEAEALSTDVARDMARRLVAAHSADVKHLPDGAFDAAMEAAEGDPLRVAARMGASVLSVMRRIALRPGAVEGLVVCDAAGALLLCKPVPGFRPPRFGAGCALWPLFTALTRPFQPIAAELVMAGRNGDRFAARAYAEATFPDGFAGVEVRQAGMLLTPLAGIASAAALRVGATCRICPEGGCPARREPSILAGI